MAEIPALHPWKQAPSAPRRRSSSSVKYPTLSAAPSINGASAWCRITKAMTSAGSMRQSSPRAALPIGEHACSCHAAMPDPSSTRYSSSNRPMQSRRRVEITDTGIPAAVSARTASMARLKLPACRPASCTSSGPSMDTATDDTPACFSCSSTSGDIRYPLVITSTRTPSPVSRPAICAQSRRRNTSPPISDTLRQPRSASCSAASMHSAVDSSSALARPPADPQYLHPKQHANVSSHTQLSSRNPLISLP